MPNCSVAQVTAETDVVADISEQTLSVSLGFSSVGGVSPNA